MSGYNTKGSSTITTPLGTNAAVPFLKEDYIDPSVVIILMYLYSNAHPKIQFTVHKCARFTHYP